MRKFFFFVFAVVILASYLSRQVQNGSIQLYLDSHADSFLVKDIQYFAGWYKYAKSEYNSSAYRFSKFLKMYPDSKYAEDALFLLGVSYEESHRRPEAKSVYAEYLVKYEKGKKSEIVKKKMQYLQN